jgi:hypothetical protein
MPNAYTWQVVSQTNDSQFDNMGNVTYGKTVTFTIEPINYTGTLFIPNIIYAKPDAVQETIQAEVDNIMAVHNLSG